MSTYSTEDKARIDGLVTQWLALDTNEQSRNEILDLQKNQQYLVLDLKLSKRISFGTAGLRSSMESGFAHMNDVTILQASQGLVKYLVDQSMEKSIVIGYDHRFHSQRFAEITASVALTQNFKVYYLGAVDILSPDSGSDAVEVLSAQRLYVHTPLVPFSIDFYGASAGVMVTASHNPAKDNGYKVYYGNGCQIIPPHDKGIAESIDSNLVPWDGAMDVSANFSQGRVSGQLVPVKEEVTREYLHQLHQKLVSNTTLSYSFVYTPMHGVGLEIFDQVVGLFRFGPGHQVVAVDLQSQPDPSFPTVRFPNPEEHGALDLAMDLAEARGLELVVATDPDADRFSAAVKHQGQWRQLTGNEIGFLFAMYMVEQQQKTELSNVYLVNSTVSSQVLRSMAEIEGFHYEDTLTGFKWIGNKAIDLKKEGFSVPFGYEEAIGYMFSLVNDKDGISAAAVWLQLYQKWVVEQGISLIDKLAAGYLKYGWYKECNGYYKLQEVTKTDEIFGTIRQSYGASGSDYPLAVGPFEVLSWRDLTVGYDSTTSDHIPRLPTDALSQMITATMRRPQSSDVVRFTCRGSGTEPKLKVYIEGQSAAGENEAAAVARRCWEALREEWFRPAANGLEEVV